MATTFDLARTRLTRTVANDRAGFWSAALDAAGKRLFVGGTDFRIHVFDLPGVEPAKLSPLKGHRSYVTALAYLPADRLLVSGGYDGQLLCWKLAPQPAPVRGAEAGGRVNRLAASPDGKAFATATDDLVLRVWDAGAMRVVREARGGHPLETRRGRNTLYALAYSPDGKRLATGDRAGTVCLWEAATGRLLHAVAAGEFYSHEESGYEWGGVRALAFTPDGSLLVAGGMGSADRGSAGIDGPMRLAVYDAATGKSLAAFEKPEFKGLLNAMSFHPGGQFLAAGGGGGEAGNAGVGGMCLWDHRLHDKAGKPLPPAMLKSAIVVRDLAFCPDGKRLLVVGMLKDLTAGRVEVWEFAAAVPGKS